MSKFKLKTSAIPPFYKIITDNQSTKLVYRNDRGSKFKRRGLPADLSIQIWILVRG